MDKQSLKKFKTYLEYELHRKCYSDEYHAVLHHFAKQVVEAINGNVKRLFFLNPRTMETYGIHNGRSIWEDRIDKADFILVQEVCPSMETTREQFERGSEDKDGKILVEYLKATEALKK